MKFQLYQRQKKKKALLRAKKKIFKNKKPQKK